MNEVLHNPRYKILKDYINNAELCETGKSMKLYESQSLITNSEMKSKCWFMENPQSKDLVKHITLKLGPGCDQEFIIVAKATITPKPDQMMGAINLKMVTHDHSEFYEQVQASEDNQDLSLEEFASRSELQIMLIGKIDPPKIFCPRILKQNGEHQIIPLALKRVTGHQKFRVPFRNEGSSDADIEFSFIKVGESASALLKNEFSMNEVLEFYCMPGNLKIPKNTN